MQYNYCTVETVTGNKQGMDRTESSEGVQGREGIGVG